MAVANYRPFRMCASVPGLLFSSICVNVSDLNQLANTIVVCPRLEISTKIQRWQIGYICQNISTTLPTGIPAITGPAPAPGTPNMPAVTPRPPAGAPAPPGAGAVMMPPGAGAVMMPPGAGGVMMPPGAGGVMMPPGAGGVMMPPGAAGVMMPPGAGGVMMPPGAGAAMVPPGAGGIMPRPLSPAATPPITGMMMMAMRPVMMPGAMPPAATPAAAVAPRRPPTAPAPPGGAPPMPPAGAIVPRPADGLLYNLQPYSLEPLFRLEIVDPSDNSTAGLANPALPNSMLLPLQPDQFEQRSPNEDDTEFAISDNKKHAEFNETIDDKISITEDPTEPITPFERAESTRILKRTKRQYDIFDIFQQSNRCDRAYRICITRSNNYIISRVRTTRFNGNINQNMQCNEKPTKIVHTSGQNLCSYLTSTINNDSESSFSSTESSTLHSDSLEAIIVHDDSDDDSTFYSQNYPQIASIIPYNRPRSYPARTPPQVVSELQEQLKNLTNDAIKISRL